MGFAVSKIIIRPPVVLFIVPVIIETNKERNSTHTHTRARAHTH